MFVFKSSSTTDPASRQGIYFDSSLRLKRKNSFWAFSVLCIQGIWEYAGRNIMGSDDDPVVGQVAGDKWQVIGDRCQMSQFERVRQVTTWDSGYVPGRMTISESNTNEWQIWKFGRVCLFTRLYRWQIHINFLGVGSGRTDFTPNYWLSK